MRPVRTFVLPLILAWAILMPPAPSLAQTCVGFSPARQDLRGSAPTINRPIAALPGDFDMDGIIDLAVVNKYIDGFLIDGSVTLMKGDSSGNFTAVSTQIVEGGAQWGATADFNKDGKPDVAVVTNDKLLVLLGTGAGAFQPAMSTPVAFDPAYLTVADMNADANTDLVVVQRYIGQSAGRVTVLCGDGTGHFNTMTPAAVGQDPRGAAVSDFNGDGKLDVVAANNLSDNLWFLPGLGNGNFGPGTGIPLGASASYVAAADFSGDGKLDLIVTGETVSTPAIYLTGAGNGTFTIASTLSVGDTPRNPVVCDFDRNGLLDVAVPNAGTADVTLLYSIGPGIFDTPLSIGSAGGPVQAAVSDLNHDGVCDVVVANDNNNSISLMRGGPLGNPGAPVVPTGGSPLGEAAADFNGDGHIDLAVANRDDDTVSIYLGDGEGRMTPIGTLSSPVGPAAIAAADFNLDGAPDLVVGHLGVPGNTQNDTIDVFFNIGLGQFSLPTTLSVGDVPLDIEIGDFDSDGRPDIAVANSQSDKVSFYYAQPAGQFSNVKNIRISEAQRTLAAGDFNADGLLDLAVGIMGQNALVPLFGTSQGSFQKGTTMTLGGAFVIDQIVSRDLNGDQQPDLVVISQSNDPSAAGQLRTLLGASNGTFSDPWPPQPTGTFPEAVELIDLDRDGAFDAVVANRFDNDVMMFQGDPTGHFVPMAGRYGVGNGPYCLVSADFNEDFRTDIAAASWGGNSVSILLNDTAISEPTLIDFVSDHQLVWDPVPGAVTYNLYREGLENLDVDDFGQCLAPELSQPTFDDATPPAPGAGFFYLVTVVGSVLEGPLGYSSNCIKRPNFHPCGP